MKLTQEEWIAVSKHLDEALDLPEDARSAWLEGLSDLDVRLKDALREMLARPETGDFLNTLPVLPPEPEDSAAEEIGPYRLLRELGRGGMGAVWLAERSDGVLKRPIALKLPHAGSANAQFLERFHRERDILASLTHPHIARLYDAGLAEGGRPFIALEYVDGSAITAHCDAQRINLRERLKLFLDVLAAVQYAHAHLVLHRDLKPSNILVAANGEVKLLDFGIAKLMTGGEARETELTELGGRALTIDYASPEQIAGLPMSTASDVYSLGVVLYELLAGERPYALKRISKGALEDAILTADVVRPSQAARDSDKALARGTTPKKLAAVLKGDLDTIVAKALKKEPSARYPTADAFAQDLRRYLAGEAVLAQPESVAYRAKKFVLRHKLPVLASTGVVLALAAGLGVALWEARVANREARTSAAVEKFLEDIFRANSSDQPNPVQARQTTARELLDIGANKIDSELGDSPAAKLSLLRILGGLYADLGLDDRSVSLARKQVALARSMYGNQSPEVAQALIDLAGAMHSSQSAGGAAEVLQEAGKLLDARRDFTSLTRALLLQKMAEFYFSGDLPKAAQYAHQAAGIYRAHPPSTDFVEALYLEGLTRNQLGAYDQAVPLFQEAIALSRKLSGDPNPSLPRLYAVQGQVQEAAWQFAAAEDSLRKALAAARAVNGDDHVDAVQTGMRLGMFLGDTSRPREALEYLRQARDTVLKIRGPDDSFHTPQVLLEYGSALAHVGRIEEGVDAISQAVENRRKNRPGTRFLANMLEYQARVLIELGDFAVAHKLLDEADAILKKTNDTADYRNAYYRARLLLAEGKPGEAAGWVEPAGTGPLSSSLLRATVLQAEIALARGDAGAAISLATGLRERIAESTARPYLKEMDANAALLEGQGYLLSHQAPKALPLLDHAVELRAAMFDPVSPALGDAYAALGECHAALGDRARAQALLAQARAIAAAHPKLGRQHTQPIEELEAELRRR